MIERKSGPAVKAAPQEMVALVASATEWKEKGKNYPGVNAAMQSGDPAALPQPAVPKSRDPRA
jgi:hypothetical protein